MQKLVPQKDNAALINLFRVSTNIPQKIFVEQKFSSTKVSSPSRIFITFTTQKNFPMSYIQLSF